MTTIKKNYIYNLVYQVLTFFIPLITVPYVSRVLHADGVGLYSYSLSIVTYFGLFGSLGTATYGQLKTSECRDNPIQRTENFLGILLARLMTLGLMVILYSIFALLQKEYRTLYLVLVIYLVSCIIDISWFFQGMEMFKITVTRNGIIKVVSMIMIFIFVRNENDIILYAFILQGSTFLGNITLWITVGKYLCRVKKNNIHIFVHLRKSIVYFIPTVATSVYTVLDKSMIGWITQSSAQNGYYEQSHKIVQVAVTVVTALSAVVLPRNRYLFSKGNIEEIKNQINKSLKYVSFIAAPMLCGLIAVSDYLIPIYLGSGYEECIILTCVFSFLVLAIGLNNTLGMQCLMACKKQKKFNIGVVGGAVTNLILNAVLIPNFGSLGASIASVLSEITILCIFAYFSKDYFSIKTLLCYIVRYMSIGFLMLLSIRLATIVLPVSIVSMCILITIGILIYFAVLFILKDEFLYESIKKIKRR